ncbi:hypothetical protein [Shewanella hanedai]|uniref:WxxW domain-containing protein n=2 Tax=Shewanella hanedai TaxID=25 RepID=A0A553JDS7_SHEHA|nr:hypothetical protein [Shewanella hanedai]TRY10618.1 hypothetical protein FN961_25225 [Shewanella hanedai]
MKKLTLASLFGISLCSISGIAISSTTLPVKSNMGSAEEIFIKRDLLSNLSTAASQSNLYLLPLENTVGEDWTGDFFINDIHGFSLLETMQGQVFSNVELLSPAGNRYRIQGGEITCAGPDCVELSSHVEVSEATAVRTISINRNANILGRWQIKLNGLSTEATNANVLVSYEQGVNLAIWDADQVSLSSQPNRFLFELRVPNSEQEGGQKSAPYSVIKRAEIEALDARAFLFSNTEPAEFTSRGAVDTNAVKPNKLKSKELQEYEVSISPEGEISTTIPKLAAGDYRLEVEFSATVSNGDVIQRTGYYGFPVLGSEAQLTSASRTKVLDENRLSVDIGIEGVADKALLVFYAEIWRDGKPVSTINTITSVHETSIGNSVTVALDSRWFALAETHGQQGFEFRNIRLLDPNTYLLLDSKTDLFVPVSAFPEQESIKASAVEINDEMLLGKNDITVPVNNAQGAQESVNLAANGIMLVHGWCSNTSTWQQWRFNDGPTVEYNSPITSMGRNDFAIELALQSNAAFRDWFSVVAHSQGGQAAVHMQSYYFTGLDNSPAPRPIQTVGTPYQGSLLMDLYVGSGAGMINDIFNIDDCQAQWSLTTASSIPWAIMLPFNSQQRTFYYRTTHGMPSNWWESLQFWRWKCNAGSWIIPGADDGVVSVGEGWLGLGNDMGIMARECHTGGMNFMDQRRDNNRNDIMDEMGRVPASWTQWLDRDDPGGSGDWESRAAHPAVCANPWNFQARRRGTTIPATQTGEIFSTLSANGGLVCRNADQPDGVCFDYEVRFFCP